MSTYLLALVIGEFDCLARTSRHILTTVYTVPGKAAQAHFCLDTAVRALNLYQDLFQIPYPLVKSDLLAIPDFAAGAMENWGCVTYREAKVLVQEGVTSESTRRGIARTVCHELAHMWFGNLTTMEFWTQLWLKEGVARYMEFVGIDALYPDWDAWTEFVQSVYGLALSLDAMLSSHPVEVEVHHPDEITEIFDAISYAKGASIIRMIASYIGVEKFYLGVRIYLTRHAYGNAVTNDLWRALEDSSGVNVVDFMRPWTLEVGYPVISLADGNSIRTSRFLARGNDESCDGNNIWPVPITALVEGETTLVGPWLLNGPDGDETEELQKKVLEWTSAGKWFKLNADQTGFYRVTYSRVQWLRLSAVMDPGGHLSVTDRLGLISDSFASGLAGYTSIVDSLMFIQNFGLHKWADYTVWQELSENLSSLLTLFRSQPWFDKLQEFVRAIYGKQYLRLTWESASDESARVGTLRATVIGMMCATGDVDVLREAHERFMQFKQNRRSFPIPGDLQSPIFTGALRHDEASVYEALKDLAENSSTFPEEQRTCLAVMGRVNDPFRHAEMLQYTLLSGQVRVQDISFPLASLSGSNDAGGRACWTFLRQNFSALKLRLGPMWGACVGLCCRGLTTQAEADEVEAFFGDATAGSTRRLQQALEIVQINAARRDRDRESVEAFLENFEAQRQAG